MKDGIIKHEKHNPDYRLIGTTIFDGSKFIEFVYCISNKGDNEGMELYFKNSKDGHFYTSRRYLFDEIPKKYQYYFECLSSRRALVNEGHKLTVQLINE